MNFTGFSYEFHLFVTDCGMEHMGFEPTASTMRMLRAPNCANAPYRVVYHFSGKNQPFSKDFWRIADRNRSFPQNQYRFFTLNSLCASLL